MNQLLAKHQEVNKTWLLNKNCYTQEQSGFRASRCTLEPCTWNHKRNIVLLHKSTYNNYLLPFTNLL